ncbi:MAG: fibronectin type III domain-containing protein [Bdellovibrionota bacterium]
MSPTVEDELSSSSILASSLPPTLVLQSFPASVTKSTSASIMFKATAQEQNTISSVKCTLDNMAPVDCMQGYNGSNISDGPHRLVIMAMDSQGLSSAEVSVNWMVDTRAPTVSFVMGPSAIVSTANLNITFSAMDSGSGVSSVVCALDNSPVNCPNGSLMLNNLTAGMKSLKITATDLAQNVFNLSQSFEVKFNVPSVTLTANPPGFDKATSATFSFTGMSNGQALTKFECSRDDVTYAACNSGTITYNNIAEGNQKFYVRSIDGNGVKSASQLYSWVADRTMPVVAFSATPAATTTSTNANFSFTISEAGTNQVCSLDNVNQTTCNSPMNFTNLPNGSHIFKVTATDKAGNVGSASYTWTINTVVIINKTIAWDATTLNEDGTSAFLTGYKLFYGTAPGAYSVVVAQNTIGNNTSYMLPLEKGKTYYFAVTAVSIAGIESNKSTQISYLVP